MRRLLTACLLSWSSTALAAPPDISLVPKPELVQCEDGRRCMDTESYKNLVTMRADYVWLFDFYAVDYPNLKKSYEAEIAARKAATEECSKGMKNLAKEYDRVSERYINLIANSNSSSIFDHPGGMITTGAVGVVIGVLATTALVIALD